MQPTQADNSVTGAILVVASDPSFRRSLKFALEADGFVVEAKASLALPSVQGTSPAFACAVVDEGALGRRFGERNIVFGLGVPVVLLVDERRCLPALRGMTILTKPLAGSDLMEAVRLTALDGCPADIRENP